MVRVHVKRVARFAGSLLMVAAAAAAIVSLADSAGLVFRYAGGRPRDVGYGWLAHLATLALGSDVSTRLPAACSRYYELASWGDFLRFQAAAIPLNILLAWLAALVTLPVTWLLGWFPANRKAASVFSWKPSSLFGVWLVFLSPVVLHLSCEMSMVGLWLYEYSSRLATGAGVLALLWLVLRWPLNKAPVLGKLFRAAAAVVVVVGAVAVVGGTVIARSPASTPMVAPAGESHPNILLISIDTLRPDHLSAYGYSRETSPNLDALASEGALFQSAVAPTSWTLPSHVTMLTSLPPHQHQVAADLTRLRDDAVTLAEVLRSAGYETAAFVSGPYLRAEYGHRQGFDLYDDYTAMPLAQNAHRQITSPTLIDSITGWLNEWHDKGQERPFFVFLHMW
ncbi:MAG: sulfatase-like hydrolase/transferase, partial [bacterium]|nr:sulfatase-like hydrolase/transferase [bacterium]